MAILRKRALFDDVEHLTEMIRAYKNVIKKLSIAEVKLISIPGYPNGFIICLGRFKY